MRRRLPAAFLTLFAFAAFSPVLASAQAADPQGVDDQATISEDAGTVPIDVLANDTDSDGGEKTVVSVTQGGGGSVAATGSGLTYTPNADFCGDDAFTYTLNGGSDAFVDVTVTCVDDAPVAVDDTTSVKEDDAVVVEVLTNDTDIDGGTNGAESASDPPHGTTLLTEAGVGYAPDDDFCGADSFTYTLNGGSSATVRITVTCVSPDTTITGGSKKVVTRHRRAKVRFRFVSTDGQSRFECRVDRRKFRACAPGQAFRVKPGRHLFRVRAIDAFGKTDPIPAQRKFRVVRRQRR